ncbi:MAG: LytR family transcriptional regulator [Actinobacteria bacterium]|nr:LytR family transcriptional regulator [Actinomycetota bacterium]
MSYVPPTPPLAPKPGPAPKPGADAAVKRRWPKRALIGFLIAANLGIFGGLGAVWWAARQVTGAVATLDAGELGLTRVPPSLSDPRTFLLVGSDSRADLPEDWEGYGSYGGQRADVIILVQVLPQQGGVQMLSIPRDTKVTINGRTDRINAFFNDGASRLVAAVSEFTGLPIHHYLQVDFAGFAGVVDAVGGLRMTFPYPARDRKAKLNVPAGPQTLDGRTALALARSRSYQELRNGAWVYLEASDLGRTRRQQELLMALFTQVERPSSVGGFTDLLRSLKKFVTADNALGEDEIIQVAWSMRSLTPESVEALTLPVDGLEENGVSYVVARQPQAGEAFAAFRAGEPLIGALREKGRVAVLNGNGVAGSAGAVADRLREAGWEVVSVGDSGRADYATTLVVAQGRYLTQAEALQAFLGYGRVEQGSMPRDTDLVVIVGADGPGS